jgi:hypothetical protein
MRCLRAGEILVAMAAILAIAPAGRAEDANPAGPSAAERMLAPDAQGRAMVQRTGTWTVVSTLKLTPDAQPIVQKGLVAERAMVGPYLQETLQPVKGSAGPDFRRIAYLTYFRVEGRWQYVSLDTRFPVGVMPAYSFGKGTTNRIELEFQPIAFVGLGRDVEGRMIRSNLVISWDGPDHETTRQYWIAADGSGQSWLAVEYDYTRITPGAPNASP